MVENVLAAAINRGCTMLHPGYGFLSENANFVDTCKQRGINFIGPNVRILYDELTVEFKMFDIKIFYDIYIPENDICCLLKYLSSKYFMFKRINLGYLTFRISFSHVSAMKSLER